MNYLPFNLFKCLLLLSTLFKIILLLGHVVQRAYNLAVIWDVHPPKTHRTQEGLCFLFTGWWRHSCHFVDDIHWDLTAPIVPFYSPKLDLLSRSLDFTSFNGETGFQKVLNYFLPFLVNSMAVNTYSK